MTRPERVARGLYWDRGLSLVEGCTPVSAGCRRCWSASQTHIRSRQLNCKMRARYAGLTNAGGGFTGAIRLMEGDLEKPLRRRIPTTYAIWNDLFHPDVPFDFITEAFDMMCSWRRPTKAAEREGDEMFLEDSGHTFLVLTKRPERIEKWLWWETEHRPGNSPLSTVMEVADAPKNIFLGVSIEDQPTADERLPYLRELAVQGWHTFISAEPLLGPGNFGSWLQQSIPGENIVFAPDGATRRQPCEPLHIPATDWVICGCESGPKRRIDPDWRLWARDLKNECLTADVPFFLKQGPDEKGRVVKMPELDGRVWDEMPEGIGTRG